jgi:hypothetical protein
MTSNTAEKPYERDERHADEQHESPDAEYTTRDGQPVNEEASETAQEIEDQNHPRE